MRVLSFISLKGGVAKTTSSISAAVILAGMGFSTLLVDLNPQADATSHFVEDPAAIEGKTIHQVLTSKAYLEECLIPVADKLFMVPAELGLVLTEVEMAMSPNRNFRLHEVLQDQNGEFDFCILDTPNALGLLSSSAIIASDDVIIPTQCEKWAAIAIETTLSGFADCLNTERYTGKRQRIHILPTFYEDNRKMKAIMLEKLGETYPDQISDTVIHMAADISKTYAQTGQVLSKSSRAYKEYHGFLKTLILPLKGAKEAVS